MRLNIFCQTILLVLFYSVVNAQNLAQGKPASALVSFSGINPSSAFDDNINTIWASDVNEKTPWLQVNLGSPQTIGRIEVVARQDGDQPGTRYFFEIRGSNTPDFSSSTFLATPGGLPFSAYGTWVGNVEGSPQFQYIRLVRLNNAGHMNLAEMRVFSNSASSNTDNNLNYPEGNNSFTVGTKMLVLKSSGKAMQVVNATSNNTDPLEQASYSFSTNQQWSITDIGGGEYYITNANSSLCIDVPNGNFNDGTQVQQYYYAGGFNQKWKFIAQAGGFYSIVNPTNNKCLQVTNDRVVIGSFSGADHQLWRITDSYMQHPKHSNTDWLSEAKYGIMMHWLLGSGNKNLNSLFDVNYLADQLSDAGAKYLIITLGQNSGYYNSPNETYDAYTGYDAGDRLSARDLPMELFDALNSRGIKLMLYLPSQVANQDPNAQQKFGLPTGATDQPVNMEFAMKWAQVIQEWSDRYGSKISGWWFDGGYAQVNYTQDIFDVYTNAVKHGNHNALVAYNPGIILVPHATSEDYTAGETNEPFSLIPEDRFIGGEQWHVMTYLGSNWLGRAPRNTSQEWINWLTQVFAKGGAVDIDAGPNYDPNAAPVGSISEEMLVYFRQFKSSFQNTTNVEVQSKTDHSVFPSPSTGKFTLQLDSENSYARKVTVYNAMGQWVSDVSVNANTSQIFFDLSDKASGLYFIQVQGVNSIYTYRLLLDK
jgi:hypothetical protein